MVVFLERANIQICSKALLTKIVSGFNRVLNIRVRIVPLGLNNEAVMFKNVPQSYKDKATLVTQ